MKAVIVAKIKVDELNEEQIIYLKEEEGERILPVIIGIPEVNAIKMKLSGLEMPRPLTHDLIGTIVEALGGKVLRVLIDKLQENTFFAKVVVRKETGEEVFVDARPSDSIAIALRTEAPIFVDEKVLDVAGILPSS